MRRMYLLVATLTKPLAGLPARDDRLPTLGAADKTKPAYKLDRTFLPIREPNYPHSTVLDARNARRPARFQGDAPEGAANVLVVLIDDMGFGMSSAFGGPISMPTVERLAKGGLRYNHFHTTALCSPTRAALLTGRNHHMCNMGSITETATAFPGQIRKVLVEFQPARVSAADRQRQTQAAETRRLAQQADVAADERHAELFRSESRGLLREGGLLLTRGLILGADNRPVGLLGSSCSIPGEALFTAGS